jgi:heme oxygenase
MFYGYFHPLEIKIQAHIGATQLVDIGERRKAGAILHDLARLSFSDNNIPECLRLPGINSVAEAFGALYVLEGSTLGGKMIAKMLLKKEALSIPENALTFFTGYGEQTGPKWKSFLAVFNQQEKTSAVVRTANDTFLHLKSWMQHSLYHGEN